jgi:hypothetical protein
MFGQEKGDCREKRPAGVAWLDNAAFVQALEAGMSDPEALMRLGEVAPQIRAWLLTERRDDLNLRYLAANDMAALFDAWLRRGLCPSTTAFAAALALLSFSIFPWYFSGMGRSRSTKSMSSGWLTKSSGMVGLK